MVIRAGIMEAAQKRISGGVEDIDKIVKRLEKLPPPQFHNGAQVLDSKARVQELLAAIELDEGKLTNPFEQGLCEAFVTNMVHLDFLPIQKGTNTIVKRLHYFSSFTLKNDNGEDLGRFTTEDLLVILKLQRCRKSGLVIELELGEEMIAVSGSPVLANPALLLRVLLYSCAFRIT